MRDEIKNKTETVCSAMAELFHCKWNSFIGTRLQTEHNGKFESDLKRAGVYLIRVDTKAATYRNTIISIKD